MIKTIITRILSGTNTYFFTGSQKKSTKSSQGVLNEFFINNMGEYYSGLKGLQNLFD